MKPGVPGGERVEVDLTCERLAARVHLEDLAAPEAIRAVDHDLAVEAAGTEQRRIEDVGAVGGGDEDDVVLHLEAVHLDEQLVERLLALVVAAAEAGAAMAADRVDLVHEDDAGRHLLRLLEEVADTRRADADEHLDEVGAGDREERDARLTGDRSREQRLAGARRPVQEHAFRNPRAERLELLRVLEELLDLVQLLHGLVRTGDVLEGDLRRVGGHALRPALPEAHHLGAASLHLVHQEDPEPDQEDEREEVDEQRPPGGRAGSLGVEGDVLPLEQVLELGRGLRRRVVDLHLVAADGERQLDLLPVRVEERLVDGAVLDRGDRLRVGHLPLLGPPGKERLARQVDEQDDDDEREESASEEPVHGFSQVSTVFLRRNPPRPCPRVTRVVVSYVVFGTRSGCNTATYGRFRYRSAKSRP